jgi:hypothetical protein
MTVQFDRVISYHQNVHTCGVARFNRGIADQLSVEMSTISAIKDSDCEHPLISIKRSEMSESDIKQFHLLLMNRTKPYSVIFHDFSESVLELDLLSSAKYVMALNRDMQKRLTNSRSDIILGFAPGAQPALFDEVAPELRLITFGMAHKINALGYAAVGQLLKSGERTYQLEISSALHEGTQFDDDFFSVGDEISEYFGGNVDFLGFLADSEVSRRLSMAHAMLAFFPKGVRENNTSVLGAMAHGLAVITNLDELSPSWMKHQETIFEVGQLKEFPSMEQLAVVGQAGRDAVRGLSYAALLAKFG